MTPAGNYLPAPQKALRGTEVAGQKRQDRHADFRITLPLRPGTQPRRALRTTGRDPRPLAPVLRPGVRSLPAGTALYARPRSGLPRQAGGVLAPAFQLINTDIPAAVTF